MPRVIDVNPGGGQNVSYLEIDESTLATQPIVFAWHYSGSVNPLTGKNWSGTDLFNGIRSALTGSANQLSVTSQLYGTNAYSQALITSFSVGNSSSGRIDPLGSLVWTYWIRAGSEYEAYGDSGEFTFIPSAGAWTISPATSDTRWISNGSSDAWTISPFSYTGASSDTHVYPDITGRFQSVTFGTYAGSSPFLFQPPASPLGIFANLSRHEQRVLPTIPMTLRLGSPSLSVSLNSGLSPRVLSSNPKILRVVKGNTLQPVGVGKVMITISQSGNTDWYQMTPALFTVTVTKDSRR